MKEEDQGDQLRWQRGLSVITLLIPHIRWNLTVTAAENKQLRKPVTQRKVHNVLRMRTSGWALLKCPRLNPHGTFANQRCSGYKWAAEIQPPQKKHSGIKRNNNLARQRQQGRLCECELVQGASLLPSEKHLMILFNPKRGYSTRRYLHMLSQC